jgi:hypothetical protein
MTGITFEAATETYRVSAFLHSLGQFLPHAPAAKTASLFAVGTA